LDGLLSVNSLAFLNRQQYLHFIVFIAILQYSLEWVLAYSSWYSD